MYYARNQNKFCQFSITFADDISLISDSLVALQNTTTELQSNAAKVGLRISAEKTKAIAVR